MAVALGVIALFVLQNEWRNALIISFVWGTISLSFVVITGYTGQISLAQLTLAGTAAFMLSYFTVSWDIPFPIAPIMAALVATAIGVVVGLPALRVRGLSVAVVTLALAVTVDAAWFRNIDIVGFGASNKVVPPTLFGIDLGMGTRSGRDAHLVRLVRADGAGDHRHRGRAAPAQPARLGDGRGPGQRAVGGRRPG